MTSTTASAQTGAAPSGAAQPSVLRKGWSFLGAWAPAVPLLAVVVLGLVAPAAVLVVPDAQELRAGLDASRRRLQLAVHGVAGRERERVGRLEQRLRSSPRQLFERRRGAIDHLGARLQSLSPHATLARGYAIVRARGGALREAGKVAPGDPLEIELASGGLAATVDEVRS